MRLKIAQVATTDTALRYLLCDQIRALERLGREVVCVGTEGRWSHDLRAEGFNVVNISMEQELAPVRDIRAFTTAHTPKAGLLAPFAARRARVPVVLHTVHGLLFHDQQSLTS